MNTPNVNYRNLLRIYVRFRVLMVIIRSDFRYHRVCKLRSLEICHLKLFPVTLIRNLLT